MSSNPRHHAAAQVLEIDAKHLDALRWEVLVEDGRRKWVNVEDGVVHAPPPKPKRQIGQKFNHSGRKYILVVIAHGAALINLKTGLPRTSPVFVDDYRDISDDEWARITVGAEFELIEDKDED